MSDTAERELLEGAYDGNRNLLDDAYVVPDGEPTDFVYDADGNELRKGDYALVLETHWPDFVDRIVKITYVSRGEVYANRPTAASSVPRAWSPTGPLNRASIEYESKSTAVNPSKLQKMDVDDETHRKLQLADLWRQRARIDDQIANLHGANATLAAKINRIEGGTA